MRAKEDEKVLQAAAREKETKRERIYRAKVRLAEGAGIAIGVHDNDVKGIREFSQCLGTGRGLGFSRSVCCEAGGG